ncbi:hypothetical protein ACF1GW_30780 [Streptomyces achromogenes]|uniref:hypothetical protein n=1 Tax=Streptomyces achromogenes TaxID=67255 RepID=UPI0036FB37F0
MTTAPAPVADTTGYDNETTHVYCCDPNTALCGWDVSDTPEVPDGVGHDCIVCTDLETQPCPICGDGNDEEAGL